MDNNKKNFLDDILANMNDDDVNKLVDIINSDDSYEDKLSKLSNEDWGLEKKERVDD